MNLKIKRFCLYAAVLRVLCHKTLEDGADFSHDFDVEFVIGEDERQVSCLEEIMPEDPDGFEADVFYIFMTDMSIFS